MTPKSVTIHNHVSKPQFVVAIGKKLFQSENKIVAMGPVVQVTSGATATIQTSDADGLTWTVCFGDLPQPGGLVWNGFTQSFGVPSDPNCFAEEWFAADDTNLTYALDQFVLDQHGDKVWSGGGSVPDPASGPYNGIHKVAF